MSERDILYKALEAAADRLETIFEKGDDRERVAQESYFGMTEANKVLEALGEPTQ